MTKDSSNESSSAEEPAFEEPAFAFNAELLLQQCSHDYGALAEILEERDWHRLYPSLEEDYEWLSQATMVLGHLGSLVIQSINHCDENLVKTEMRRKLIELAVVTLGWIDHLHCPSRFGDPEELLRHATVRKSCPSPSSVESQETGPKQSVEDASVEDASVEDLSVMGASVPSEDLSPQNHALFNPQKQQKQTH